jgi:hypothetical protein
VQLEITAGLEKHRESGNLMPHSKTLRKLGRDSVLKCGMRLPLFRRPQAQDFQLHLQQKIAS